MMRRSLILLSMSTLLLLQGLQPMFAADEKTEKKKTEHGKAVVAVFRLSGSVTEAPADDTFSFGATKSVSLKDLVTRIKKAGDDATVKALVLIHDGGSIGSAQTEEVREAMSHVRAAGKDIYAYADSMDMREYLLLSGATRISAPATSDLWITGLYGETPYLRGLLDKLHIKPDFLHCGAYKSASEIFMRDGPSPEAEKMQNWLLDSEFETFVDLIAKGRGVDQAKVREWINGGPYTAEKGKEVGLIDAVEQRQALEALLKSKYGKDVTFEKSYGKKKTPQLDLSSPFGMFKMWGDLLGESLKKKNAKDAIGIVYVQGAITLGSGESSPFGGATGATSGALRKALNDAAKDDSIKAVVLRVDSPGGSAVASEIILDATRRVKAKKPFVVSMGDVAGSGGYYVACASDTIFADESTITGSIGVVGGKMATTGLWNMVGITFKSYKRGQNADILSSERVFSPEERERMQAWMDNIYGVFKQHVVDIRGSKLKKPIDELAGGRVYTGRQALELGLVDKIGSMQDAIKYVADKAKLTKYEVRVVPEPKNFIEKLMEELTDEKDEDSNKNLELDSKVRPAGAQTSLVDLAMPYLQHLDPERVRVIRTALMRLQMIQQEGAVLMMPEITISR
ncbi:MAG TPA: signal peptide peptidase SppA [Gemmataceae bacterium]|nr:signal peptide peptidase SppA [Gemmataceae bacterium]